MSIELGDYAPWVMKYIRQRQIACVYLISYEDGRPTKIGYAQEIGARFSSLQGANAHKLQLEYLLWTPSMRIAKLIEQAVHGKLIQLQMRGEWFDVHAQMAVLAVRDAAKGYAKTFQPFVEHDDLIEQLRKAGVVNTEDGRRPPRRSTKAKYHPVLPRTFGDGY